MGCEMILANGQQCRAPAMTGKPYCWSHRHRVGMPDATAELRQLAEEFDATAPGERFTAKEFMEWAAPELRELLRASPRGR